MFALSIRGNRDIRDILRLRNLETLLTLCRNVAKHISRTYLFRIIAVE